MVEQKGSGAIITIIQRDFKVVGRESNDWFEHNGNVFAQIDWSDAYLQKGVDEEWSKLLRIA